MTSEARTHTPVCISGAEVEQVKSYRFLGFNMTEDLSWTLSQSTFWVLFGSTPHVRMRCNQFILGEDEPTQREVDLGIKTVVLYPVQLNIISHHVGTWLQKIFCIRLLQYRLLKLFLKECSVSDVDIEQLCPQTYSHLIKNITKPMIRTSEERGKESVGHFTLHILSPGLSSALGKVCSANGSGMFILFISFCSFFLQGCHSLYFVSIFVLN